MLRAPAEVWAGGGIAVQIAASLTLSSITLEQCLVVPPEVASRWPLPATAAVGGTEDASLYGGQERGGQEHAGEEQGGAAPGVWPSRLFIEEQTAGATVTLSLLSRIADLDVMRVTTVDLSPVVVVGRAACDVRVRRGEAFDLTARITPTRPVGSSIPSRPSRSPRRLNWPMRHAVAPRMSPLRRWIGRCCETRVAMCCGLA